MKVFLESGYCKLTNAQLKITKNACYLNVQVEQSDPETITGDKRIGVDLGINNMYQNNLT